MSVTCVGVDFQFGIVPDKRPLPEGWEYRESGLDWLMCCDPQGRVYFAGRDNLYPAVVIERPKFGANTDAPVKYPEP